MWVHGQWEHVNGVLLDVEQNIGTVKTFDAYTGDLTSVPDITIVKKPTFWQFDADQKRDAGKRMSCTNKGKETVPKREYMNTVLKVERRTSEGKRQLISSKQVAKLMKQGEPVFLAMIRPTSQTT